MTGRIDKQIAAEMGISLGTVRVYWKRIRMKVGGTRSEVIAELARNSLKLDFDGERNKADQLAKDLEESVQRERDLRVFQSAFAEFPTPLAIVDAPTGQILHANKAFARLHGYEAPELEGVPCENLMVPEEVARFDREAHAATEEKKSFELVSTRRHKDGSLFRASAQLSGGEDVWVLALTR